MTVGLSGTMRTKIPSCSFEAIFGFAESQFFHLDLHFLKNSIGILCSILREKKLQNFGKTCPEAQSLSILLKKNRESTELKLLNAAVPTQRSLDLPPRGSNARMGTNCCTYCSLESQEGDRSYCLVNSSPKQAPPFHVLSAVGCLLQHPRKESILLAKRAASHKAAEAAQQQSIQDNTQVLKQGLSGPPQGKETNQLGLHNVLQCAKRTILGFSPALFLSAHSNSPALCTYLILDKYPKQPTAIKTNDTPKKPQQSTNIKRGKKQPVNDAEATKTINHPSHFKKLW